MNPRRHPRSMSEAFGPYTDNTLQPMSEARRLRADWALYIVAVVALIVIWWTA